jgi:3-hydroxyisobutyrate dehydrogenase
MISFLGLGAMGAPMAQRLVDAGHDVVVWNRSPERAQPFRDNGVRVAETAAEAVRGADTVLTMLADPRAVRSVFADIASTIDPAAAVVDLSTIGPDVVRELATVVPQLRDAPVMGSVDRAAAGELVVLAGGDIEPVRPVLETFGTVVGTGEVGSGAAMKIVLISSVVAGVALVGETFALAKTLGVDEEAVEAQLRTSPLAGLLARARSADAHFAVRLAAKDLRLALEQTELPLMRAAWEELNANPDIAERDVSAIVADQIRRHAR